MLNNDKSPLIITIEEFYYNDKFLSNCIYTVSAYLTVKKGTGTYNEHDPYEEEGIYNVRDQNYILYASGDDEDINAFINASSEVSPSESHNSIYIRKNFFCDSEGKVKMV